MNQLLIHQLRTTGHALHTKHVPSLVGAQLENLASDLEYRATLLEARNADETVAELYEREDIEQRIRTFILNAAAWHAMYDRVTALEGEQARAIEAGDNALADHASTQAHKALVEYQTAAKPLTDVTDQLKRSNVLLHRRLLGHQ